MCDPMTMAVTMGAVGVGQGLVGDYEQMKAYGDAVTQQRKQQVEIIKQMNYQDVALRQDQRNAYDTAVRDLEDMQLNAIKNQGAVKAAVSESNLEGNSMDRLVRDVEGSDLRAANSVTENYERDYTSILGQRYQNWEQGKSSFNSMGKIRKPSKLSRALNIATSGISGATSGYSMGNMFKGTTTSAGMSGR